ncbi:prepilin-type N-terminal cleavage/methylation domain-containing protein [bacterium]|nr:prepilin-type N-terminal cleavage/methylation domain-containing protein [bacterium]
MRKYEGLSLVEMLITIVIITTVVLMASITLTTLIRTSAVTSARTTARQESEFVIELVRRSIRNSHTDDIRFYNVSGRLYDESMSKIINSGTVQGYDQAVGEGLSSSEIHFRPSGYNRWVCIGYFPTLSDQTKGYILKSSYPDNIAPASCFDSDNIEYMQNAVVLNNSEVFADQFEMHHYSTPSGNVLITIAIEMKSKYEMSFSKNVQPAYYKQALVATQKLTWE